MKTYALFVAVSLTALSACAKGPDAIAPISMGDAYSSMSCQQAAQALNQERQTLATLSAAQKDAVAGDAIGVFLVGVPMSSLTGGDKEGAIATSKGKVVALENRLMTCR